MITAHLPAGYILGRLLPPAPYVLPAALVGSVLPDLDMLYFYLIDDRQTHHHHYWTHVPATWAVLAVLLLPLLRVFARPLFPAAVAFFAAILLHLCLDSIVGDILWLWPVSDEAAPLITVPATRSHWLLSFLTHWTMALEAAIWVVAIALFLRRPVPA